MKKVISLIVLVSFVSVYLFCEDVTANNMLSFDTQVSGKIMINSLSPEFNIRLYGQNRNWIPYLGSTEISEVEFYSIAGYGVEEDLAAKRDSFWRLKAILLSLGLVALGTGTSYYTQGETKEFWIPDTGSGLTIIGLLSVLTVIFLPKDSKMTTTRQAQLAADAYNTGVKSTE